MKTILLMGSAALALSAFAADVKTMTKGNAHAYGGYGRYGDFKDAAQPDNDVWVWDDGTRNTPDDLPAGGGRHVVETIGEFAQVGDTFEPTLWLSNSLNRTNVNACRIRPRKMKWTFGDLHLFPGTSVISLGGNGNEIAGTVTLHGTEEHPVTFLPGGGQMNQRVSAGLKGDGLVRFLSTEYAYPNNAVTNRLTGANGGFTGAVDVTTTGFAYDYATGAYGYRDESKRNWMTLWIDSEESLGAAPSSFVYNRLRLRNGGPLFVADDVTIDDATRGIFVEGMGVMAVAAGRTLTLNVPLTVDGTLVKQGAGTLALGGRLDGTGEAPVLYRNRVRVEAGRVKPLTGRALDGAQLVVLDGAALEIDAAIGESGFRAYGLVLVKSETVAPFAQEAGDAVGVVVTGVEPSFESPVSVPLVTVRRAFAETLRGHLAATVEADGVEATVVESESLLDGVPVTTFVAQLVRTSGRFTGETVAAEVILRAGETVVAASPDHAVTFTALTVDGGAFGLTATTSDGAPGTAVLAEGSRVLRRPIRLALDETLSRPADGTSWTVLRLAASLGAFTADDFFLDWPGTDRTGATGAYDAHVAVAVENGETVVKVGFKPLKTMTKGTGSSTKTEMRWDDGTVNTASEPLSEEFAYRVFDIGNLWLFSGMRFPSQLSLFSTAGGECRIFPASPTGTTLDDCHLYPGTGLAAGGKKDSLNEVNGRITLHGTDVTNAVRFTHGEGYRHLDVRAALFGEGPLRIATSAVESKYMPEGNMTTIRLSGDNRNWTGPLQVTCAGGRINFDNETAAAWGKYETEWMAYDSASGAFMHLYPCKKKDGSVLTDFNTNWVVFPLLDEKCLGGNPRAFRRDQFLFGGACRLVVTNDVTVSAPNRGVTFESAPHVVVDAGATLTLKSPLCLAGTIWKDGAGTLCLGSPAETLFAKNRSAASAVPFAQYNRLRIEDGALALSAGKVLDGVSLRLAAGTKVMIDWADADEALKTYGLYNVKLQDDAGYLPFEWLDGVGFRVEVRYAGVTAEDGERRYRMPLVTVRSAVADAVGARLAADVSIKGYAASSVQRETFEENGVSLTRFYVDCRRNRGLAVIIR